MIISYEVKWTHPGGGPWGACALQCVSMFSLAIEVLSHPSPVWEARWMLPCLLCRIMVGLVLESEGSIPSPAVSDDPCLGPLGRFHWQILHTPDALAWHWLCSPWEGGSGRGPSLHPALELHEGMWIVLSWFCPHKEREPGRGETSRGLARRCCGSPSALECLLARAQGDGWHFWGLLWSFSHFGYSVLLIKHLVWAGRSAGGLL